MQEDRYPSEIRAPRRRKKPRDEVRLVASAYRRAMRLLRASNCKNLPSRGKAKGRGLPNPGPMQHLQRANIRMTYARNKGDQQWGAHGRYLSRESANPGAEAGLGFGSAGNGVPIVETLNYWQQQGDALLFKFILSPEFGEGMDLRLYARELVASLEKDLGIPLEWVGIDHYNTEHPHAHLAVRGVDDRGRPLRIDPNYIKTTMRLRARQVATMQLGYRRDQDIADARARQVSQQRFTDLDRMILRRSTSDADGSCLVDFGGRIPVRAPAKEGRVQQIRRLVHLERMGLAERLEPMKWRLSPALQSVLRQRQMATDRLKVRFRNRDFLSDERIPIRQTDMHFTERVSGRMIGTGLDEQTDKPYMLIESVEGVVHYLYQSSEAIQARSKGLKTGNFVELRSRRFVGTDGVERTRVKFRSLGNANALLGNMNFLQREVRQIVEKTGTLPAQQGLGGWLGQYQRALCITAERLIQDGLIRARGDGKFLFDVSIRHREASVPPHAEIPRHLSR